MRPLPVRITVTVLMALVLAVAGASQEGMNKGNKAPKKPHITTNKYKDGELLVKFKRGVGSAASEKVARGHGAAKIKSFRQPRKLKSSPMDRWRFIQLGKGVDTKQAMLRLAADPNVEYVEPNYEIKAVGVPDDPRFYDQWGLHNVGQDDGVPDADIDAVEAWDVQAGSGSVVVAVIDSGVEYTHPDLAANMWVNTGEIPGNGVDDDGNGFFDDVHGYDFTSYGDGDPDDLNGHGTHVAGIVGAVGNNAVGVSGVSQSVRIMAIKVLGGGGTGDLYDAINGILYAADMGAHILNNSWGNYLNPALEGPNIQALRDAVLTANAAGALFVAAAGNDNIDNDSSYFYPANTDAPNVITVAATTRHDAKAAISNYGATMVDVAAPGEMILSTAIGGGYEYRTGTSMAAPHVAGAAALFLAQNPSLDVNGLKSLIMDRSDRIAAMRGISVTGGRLNAAQGLNCDPTQLTVGLRSPHEGFAVLQGDPVSLQAQVTQCGIPVTDATVYINLSNGDGAISLFDYGLHGDGVAGDGIYANYWVPGAIGALNAGLTVSHASFPAVNIVHTGEVRERVRYQHEAATFQWIDATAGTAHTLTDDGSVNLPIGFDFPFYGLTHTSVNVSANGVLTFGPAASTLNNGFIPDPAQPNNMIAPFWDDLNPAAGGEVYTLLDGVAPNRRLTVAWVGVPHYGGVDPVTFEATLYEGSGDIVFQYQDIDFGDPRWSFGADATVGVEDPHGLDATPYIYNQPNLENGSARRFYTVPTPPEITYRVTVDTSGLRTGAGYLVMDMIDGDGINNNYASILKFETDGEINAAPVLTGDASGDLIPGPAHVGDGQFINEISNLAVFGDEIVFLLRMSTNGSYTPFPDSYAFYVLDENGVPYATDDPLGTDALFVIEIDGAQPFPQVFQSSDVSATVDTVGAPIAVPGGPYYVLPNVQLTLDGSGSSDPEGSALSYAWDFGDGTTGVGAQPVHTYSTKGVYTVSLVVSDGQYLSKPGTTTVNVVDNFPPVADAGPDQVVYHYTRVYMDGSSSSDPDGVIESYEWAQVSGSTLDINLEGQTSALASFEAPGAGDIRTLGFQLTVTDDKGGSSIDEVTVHIINPDYDGNNNGIADGWEIAYYGEVGIVIPGDDDDGDGLSNQQEGEQGTNPFVPEPVPGAVEHIAVLPGAQENRIIWDGSKGTARYNLYWSTVPGVNKTSGTKIAGVESPFIHSALTDGTAYYYVITAENNAGESAESVEVSGTPGSGKVWHGDEVVAAGVNGAVSAMDSLGNTFIVYSANNNIWLEEYRAGTGWKQPIFVDQGISAKVAMSPNGNAIIAWLRHGEASDIWVKTYNRDKDLWSGAVSRWGSNPFDQSYGGDGVVDFDVAISDSGNAVLAFTQLELRNWATTTNTYGTFYLPERPAFTTYYGWDFEYPIDDIETRGHSSSPSVSISPDGLRAVVSWVRNLCNPPSTPCAYGITARASVFKKEVALRDYTDYPWTSSYDNFHRLVPDPVQLDDGADGIEPHSPITKIDDGGNALIVWGQTTNGTQTTYDVLSRYYDRVNDLWDLAPAPVGSGLDPDLEMELGGEALVVWREIGNNSDSVKSKRYVPGLGWDTQAVDALASDTQLPQIKLSMRGDGNAKLLWQGSANNLNVNDYNKASNAWTAGSQINVNTIDAIANPVISSDSYGNSVVSWNQAGSAHMNHYAVSHLFKAANLLPVANAGPDVVADEGTLLVLDGSQSTDADGAIFAYQWVKVSGDLTEPLSDPDTATPSLTLPYVPVNSQLQATYELTVTDNMGGTSTDTVQVVVRDNTQGNVNPVVVYVPVAAVKSGEMVNIKASASYDPDGIIVSYSWYQAGGPDASVIDTGLPTISFTAPMVSDTSIVTLRLTVIDDDGGITEGDVDVTIQPDLTLDEDGDGLPDAWEIGNFPGSQDDPLPENATGDYDADGISNFQEYLEGTDPTTPEPAPNPVVQAVASSGDSSVVISWPRTKSAINYDLYWGTAPDITKGTGTRIANVTTPYNHTGLINGTTYYYFVVASNLAGESLGSPIASATPAPRLWQGAASLGFTDNTTSFNFDLKVDGLGNAILASAINDTEDYVMANHFKAGQGWGDPRVVAQLVNWDIRGGMLDVDLAGNAIAGTNYYWSPTRYAQLRQYNMATDSWVWTNTFTNPGLTAPSVVDLALDSRGGATVILADQGTPNEIWASDLDEDTQTWRTPYLLKSNGAWPMFMETTESGYGLMFFDDSSIFYFIPHSGWIGPFQPPVPLTWEAKLGMDQGGNMVAVYYSGAAAEGVRSEISAVIRQQDGFWTAPIPLHAIAGTNTLWALDVAPNGSAIAIWHLDAKGKAAGFYSARYIPGTGWEVPIKIDIAPESSLDVALDAQGNAVLVWVDNTRKGDVIYGHHLPAGSVVWTSETQLNELQGTVTQGPKVVTGPAGNTIVAWEFSDTSGSLFYANRYGADLASQNSRPLANAGAELVTVDEGDAVTLDGSGSNDPLGSIVSYKWIQLSGPPVTMTGVDAAIMSFTAPAVTETSYMKFALTVLDDFGETSTDIISVKINDVLPNI